MRKAFIAVAAVVAAAFTLASASPIEARQGGHQPGSTAGGGGFKGGGSHSIGGGRSFRGGATHNFSGGRSFSGPRVAPGSSVHLRSHHQGGHHHRGHRYYRGGISVLPLYGYSYYDDGCEYYWRMYLDTGRKYWKYRYYECIE
jgi:hypothetical protein